MLPLTLLTWFSVIFDITLAHHRQVFPDNPCFHCYMKWNDVPEIVQHLWIQKQIKKNCINQKEWIEAAKKLMWSPYIQQHKSKLKCWTHKEIYDCASFGCGWVLMDSIYLIYVLNIGLNLIQTKYDKNWNFSAFFPQNVVFLW